MYEMATFKKITKDIESKIRILKNQRVSVTKVSIITGIPAGTIHCFCRAKGIKTPRADDILSENKTSIVNMRRLGWSARKIAKIFKVRPGTVQEFVEKEGIKLGYHSKYPITENAKEIIDLRDEGVEIYEISKRLKIGSKNAVANYLYSNKIYKKKERLPLGYYRCCDCENIYYKTCFLKGSTCRYCISKRNKEYMLRLKLIGKKRKPSISSVETKEAGRLKSAAKRKDLSKNYIIERITRVKGVKIDCLDITPEMIELKRELLTFYRLEKELTNGINDRRNKRNAENGKAA